MRKRKLCSGAIVSILLLFICSACSQAAPSQAPAQTDEGPEAPAPLKMLVVENIYTMGCGSDKGYYYVLPRADNYLTGNIRYIDYSSAVDVPLSSQVNSEYSSSEDPSYLDSIIGDYRLFLNNDHLYFLRTGASYYVDNSDFGSLAASAIYQMDLDGSNRQLVYQGDSSAELLPYVIGSEKDLYLLRQTTAEVELLRLGLEGKSYSEKVLLQLDFGTTFIGCSESTLYYLNVQPDMEGDNTKFTLTGFDTQKEETVEVMNWDLENYGAPVIADQMLYMVRPWKAAIDQYTLTGEKIGEISIAVFLKDTATAYEKSYLIDETIVVPCYDDAEHCYYNILIDTRSNDISRADVLLEDTEKDSVAAAIVAGNAENYLAVTERKNEKVEMPWGDGTTQSLEVQKYVYTLFSKEEFKRSSSPTGHTIQTVQ